MTRKEITNYLEEHYPHDLDNILLADGFEGAFMGVVESFCSAPKACYNLDTCIEILMGDHQDVDTVDAAYEEAVEYLEFNVTQAYVGEHTPAFIMNVAMGERKI